MKYKSTSDFQIKDMDENKGIVTGYGSIFGNVDSDGDIIMPGAFTKTLKENGHRAKYLWQHDMWKPIGKFNVLKEDNKGLYFEAELGNTQLAKEALSLMKDEILTENSVGFRMIAGEQAGQYFEIREVKLYEISAVTYAANDQALIMDAKGNYDAEKILKRFDTLNKHIKKGELSDEACYAIEAELMQLKGVMNQFLKPSRKDTSNEPLQDTQIEKTLDLLKQFNNHFKIK